MLTLDKIEGVSLAHQFAPRVVCSAQTERRLDSREHSDRGGEGDHTEKGGQAQCGQTKERECQ